jgi:hypothetical protein
VAFASRVNFLERSPQPVLPVPDNRIADPLGLFLRLLPVDEIRDLSLGLLVYSLHQELNGGSNSQSSSPGSKDAAPEAQVFLPQVDLNARIATSKRSAASLMRSAQSSNSCLVSSVMAGEEGRKGGV